MADMDEFAQTRGADDLFDDEIIPVSAEEQQVQTEVIIVPELEPVPEPSPPKEKPQVEKQPSPRGETTQRGRGGDRGRGRGRGNQKKGGSGGGRGLQDSRWADPKPAEATPPNKAPVAPAEPEISQDSTTETPEKPQESEKTQAVQADDSKSETANGGESQRVPAVRGDRSATGGIRKPKLTEEELSKRIAAAKENAVKKAAAHARAEADQASFMEREQVAAKKRREELAHRKVMDNEREQNRQRKLKSQTGREWDLEKREEDYNSRGGGSQFRRGMHGGVSGVARRDFEDGRSDDSASQASPGRGGRGRGGRGGRGRGPSRGPRRDRSSSKGPSEQTDSKKPAVKDESEFPALPAGKAPEKSEKSEKSETPEQPKPAVKPVPSMETLEATMSPVTGSWADQVDE
ncbi:hypothetical protein N7456_009628 [Penicillium angulare]|uniref:Uncharacterized protein n=1 Tax=Penicillium angulare TaxID=116970 RepID=A0A9W9K6B6_9EURO|nr:hypothetical protein N7456_009628 [Penicillium angulare]